MTNLNNFLSIILFCALFVSCSSDTSVEEKSTMDANSAQRVDNIKPSESGFYHNEAISLYMQELRSTGRNFSDQKISTAITEMAKLMEEKYPYTFGNVDAKLILDYYSDHVYVKEYGYDFLKNNIIENLSNTDVHSPKFLKFIQDVYTEEMSINEIIAKIHFESDKSEEFLVFEDVLVASDAFWSTFPTSSNSTAHRPLTLGCGAGTAIVDGGIAALTWFTGPAGILGAAFGSAIYSENCENGNP